MVFSVLGLAFIVGIGLVWKGNEAFHGGEALASGNASQSNHIKELGRVHWLRGFEQAREIARHQKKPMLVLFQEVPGCATCVGYGEQVLSNPLIVEAIESLFVPVAVYNNIAGEDKAALNSFNEPAWNNPVVRIITPEREMLAPRVGDDYTSKGLTSAIVAALRKSDMPVPEYLRLLDQELSAENKIPGQATFAMSCFWTGEAMLGGVEGVLSTRPGFLKGDEVVDVRYDPSIVSYETLLTKAQQQSCATRVYTRTNEHQSIASNVVGAKAIRNNEKISPDQYPKYYLMESNWKHIPMTEIQASRVNAAIAHSESPDKFLSPAQRMLAIVMEKYPDAGWKDCIGKDFAMAWDDAMGIVEGLRLKAKL